jgi:hypothetical protein
MGDAEMETTEQTDCRQNVEQCGKEILQQSRDAEIDNKLIAIGSAIVIIAGIFTCVASVAVGLGLIVLGLVIYLVKALNERMFIFKIRRQKVRASDPGGS